MSGARPALRAATRGSELARWQTGHVGDLLRPRRSREATGERQAKHRAAPEDFLSGNMVPLRYDPHMDSPEKS